MTSELIPRLRNVPIFAALSDHELEHIAALAAPFDVPAGQVLIERGQPGLGVFIVDAGTVRIERSGGQSVERGPGTFVGELAVLADVPRTARVSAVTAVQGLAIARNDLTALLERDSSIAVSMLREVSRRLAEVT